MRASETDLAALLQIQQIDLDVMRKKKQFDELPQRGVILGLRQKRDALGQKAGKIVELKRDAAKRLARINDEDASLAKKETGVQAAIENAHGDFRNVEARSKELAGIARRRGTLAADRDGVEAELAKIGDLEAQVTLAVEEIDAAEQRAVESFQQEGGTLQKELAQLSAARAKAASAVDAAVMKAYEKSAARSGGVAVARLSGSQCGACRSHIDGGRLIQLKAEAPLGTCPACKRLLIIE